MKSLNDYLDSKREVFARFYFLANEVAVDYTVHIANAISIPSKGTYNIIYTEIINCSCSQFRKRN